MAPPTQKAHIKSFNLGDAGDAFFTISLYFLLSGNKSITFLSEVLLPQNCGLYGL